MTSSNEQKYQSYNLVQQYLITRFQKRVIKAIDSIEFRSVLDVGCGEGYLARVIYDHYPGVEICGIDASNQAICRARLRCPSGDFQVAPIEALLDDRRRYDLVVCSEVLEHLPNPEKAMRILQTRARKALLVTVPHEPWFWMANLARGKYLSTFGNHPEHIQHWTHKGFVKLVSRYSKVQHTETCFPWTIVLGGVS